MAERPQPRRFPLLWQLNAHTTVSRFGPGATLDALADEQLDRLLPAGLDWLYLLGVWQTGAAGRAVSRSQPDIRRSCEEALPDVREEDIGGSCFAVTGYRVHERLGGDAALARLRRRLADRGIALMLDFVPNHTALDHPWVDSHPDRYIEGSPADLDSASGNWIRMGAGAGGRILAYGRDPYFAGWPDTLQLDYGSPAVRAAMIEQLLAAASHGDGLRCDMAMLLLPDVFERTWGRSMEPFWPEALATVRDAHPGFTFMAEVYWDREFDLQQQGFDATYDKRLYDRLSGDTGAVRGHLHADPEYQARSARFLENHDEPRAATTFGDGDRHKAAAAVAYLVPGLRFFEDGQREARRIHVPVHLHRAPTEPERTELIDFYDRLLELLQDPVLHDGDWALRHVSPAWEGNESHHRLVTFTWSLPENEVRHEDDLRYLVVANLARSRSQGYVGLPFPALSGRQITLVDQFGDHAYQRDGDQLLREGLYVDVGPWAHQVFAVA